MKPRIGGWRGLKFMATLERRGKMYYSRVRIAGKTIHRALDGDKRIAQQMLLEILKDGRVGAPGRPATGDITWDGFKRQFLAWAVAAKSKYTLAHDTRAIANLEAFRRISSLADITPPLLEDLKLHLKKAGKGHPVINREMQSIKTMMRWAESRKMIPRQDWTVCARLPVPKGRIDFYTKEEYQLLLSRCEHEHERTLALLCGRAGLRASEAYFVRWQDVDLKRGILTVSPRPGWAPKTISSTRHIPLAKDLRAHLEAVRKRSASEYLVAEAKTGWRPSGAHSMAAEFRKGVIRSARLRGRLHILRHTFASHLAQAGVPLYTISKLLGHSSIRMTEIYAHLCPDTLDIAIAKLPNLG